MLSDYRVVVQLIDVMAPIGCPYRQRLLLQVSHALNVGSSTGTHRVWERRLQMFHQEASSVLAFLAMSPPVTMPSSASNATVGVALTAALERG